VGGAAQIKAMRTVSGTLKLDLAQFRELEAFATFGSELDAISAAQLERGYRLTELLKQNLNSPMPVEEQVVVILAGTKGFLDNLPVKDVKRYESELLEWFKSRHGALLEEIRTTGGLPDAVEAAVKDFTGQFRTSEGASGLATPDATAAGDLAAEMAGGAAEATLPEPELSRAEES
jgi:F-type H+-transporting ATPase subunit alpha